MKAGFIRGVKMGNGKLAVIGLLGLGAIVALSMKKKTTPPAPILPTILADFFLNGVDINVNNVAHIGDPFKIVWLAENYPIGAYVNVNTVINGVSQGPQIEATAGDKPTVIPVIPVPAVIEITLELYDSMGVLLTQTPTSKILVM